jgi:sulfite reductase alpha subunit
MAKKQHDTPMLDELETGPWPSFVTGLKRLAKDKDYMVDLMGSWSTPTDPQGLLEGRHGGVFGYGGGVIPRFTEAEGRQGRMVSPIQAEFHTLRMQPPAGMHYNTDVLRKMCDIWETHGSGLIAFHGQSGDIMFQGAKTDKVQGAFDELNELGFDLGGAGPAVRTSMSCVGAARCEQSALTRPRTPPGGQHLPGRHPPPGAALQVQVQVQRLPQRLHELDPARRHGRHRHLARQHAHRRAMAASGLTSTA